jgi:hypothetical protein
MYYKDGRRKFSTSMQASSKLSFFQKTLGKSKNMFIEVSLLFQFMLQGTPLE